MCGPRTPTHSTWSRPSGRRRADLEPAQEGTDAEARAALGDLVFLEIDFARTGDVEVGPPAGSDELPEEESGGNRAAANLGVVYEVADIGDIGVERRPVVLDQRHPPQR